jgi:hypothetical protein
MHEAIVAHVCKWAAVYGLRRRSLFCRKSRLRAATICSATAQVSKQNPLDFLGHFPNPEIFSNKFTKILDKH